MTAPALRADPGAADAGNVARPPARNQGRPGSGPGSAPAGRGQSAGRRTWRQWRLPLALIAFVVLGGIAIAMIGRLVPPPRPNSYLDPASSAGDGSHALTDILGERGFTVVRAYSTSRAVAALRPAVRRPANGGSGTTLVITSPYLLAERQRARLGHARADLFIVEPGPAALAALAPGVLVSDRSAGRYGQFLLPRCGLQAARLAGSANVGGSTYRTSASAARCYPVDGSPSVVRYRAAGRTITILGSGAPLTDGRLARNGNAALVLNLLAARRRIVWLTPEPPGPLTATPPGKAGPSGPALIPWPAWLVAIQLGIATVLIGLWRARRLGPLITERLPVVVRASETVEGHARLYQSGRARGRAAEALRGAMLARVLPALGLARAAPQDAVVTALTARSRSGQQEISLVVYGPAPATDADLVSLARKLDELERQVRSQ